MNLILSFVHFRKEPRTLGPFAAVRLDAETLREARTGALIATHREHQWEVDGERYYRVDATRPVRIHFERAPPQAPVPSRSRELGPFERFSSVDGIAYTDERVFAFVDAQAGEWFCYDDGRHWSAMVVTDAAAGHLGKLLASLAGVAPLLPGILSSLWQRMRLAPPRSRRSAPLRSARRATAGRARRRQARRLVPEEPLVDLLH